jgi:hypothetical protein
VSIRHWGKTAFLDFKRGKAAERAISDYRKRPEGRLIIECEAKKRAVEGGQKAWQN